MIVLYALKEPASAEPSEADPGSDDGGATAPGAQNGCGIECVPEGTALDTARGIVCSAVVAGLETTQQEDAREKGGASKASASARPLADAHPHEVPGSPLGLHQEHPLLVRPGPAQQLQSESPLASPQRPPVPRVLTLPSKEATVAANDAPDERAQERSSSPGVAAESPAHASPPAALALPSLRLGKRTGDVAPAAQEGPGQIMAPQEPAATAESSPAPLKLKTPSLRLPAAVETKAKPASALATKEPERKELGGLGGGHRLALPGGVVLFEERATSAQSNRSAREDKETEEEPSVPVGEESFGSAVSSELPSESPHTYAINLPDDANPFLPGSGDEMMGFSPGEECFSEGTGDEGPDSRQESDLHAGASGGFPQLRLPGSRAASSPPPSIGAPLPPLSVPEEEASSALESEVDQFELEVDGEPGDEGWPDWQAGPPPRSVQRRSSGPDPGAEASGGAGGIPLFSAFPAYGAPPAATVERTRSQPRAGVVPLAASQDAEISPAQLASAYQFLGSPPPPPAQPAQRRRTASMDLRSPTAQLSVSGGSGRSYASAGQASAPSPLSARAPAVPATPRFSGGSYNPFQVDRAAEVRTSGGGLLQQLHQHQQQPAPQLQGLAPPPQLALAPPAHAPPSSPFTALHRPLERLGSTYSNLALSRVLEDEDGAFQSSMELEAALALKLDVLAGPCLNTSFVSEEGQTEVLVGRTPATHLALPADAEVSGRHLAVAWSTIDRCWKAADLGSLNGTMLNGEPISLGSRQRSAEYRLSSDDVLQLGSHTKIKVSIFPRDVLRPSDAQGSLPPDSLPRSLSMPKHRVMSYGSLASPSLRSATPSRQPYVTAVAEDLRLEACLLARTGREHTRKNQVCEDVACALCPLPLHPRLVPTAASLLCLFDGHCGRGAAEAAARVLPEEVANRLMETCGGLAAGKGAELTFRNAFLTTDARLMAEEGCTATAVLAWRTADGSVLLQAANVGDSSALWIEVATGTARELTEDHRLSNERERRRLSEMGIELSKESNRLYGLNLSRGLGDVFLKEEDMGLSAEPYVGPVVRCPPTQGGLVLIASDGLWDVADFATVGRLAAQAFRENGHDLATAARAVLSHAIKRRTKDDVSIILAHVWPEADWALRSPPQSSATGPVFACP